MRMMTTTRVTIEMAEASHSMIPSVAIVRCGVAVLVPEVAAQAAAASVAD